MALDRTTRLHLLVAATVAVWAAVFAASVGRFKLAAKPPLTVHLTTQPSRVQLRLDGKSLFQGRYVKTPLKNLTMAPGNHRLTIHRDGYIAHTVTVEGPSGSQFNMDGVVLERDRAAKAVPFRIETLGEGRAVFVEVDGGLFSGATPISGRLTGRKKHELTIFPDGPASSQTLTCHFTPETKEDEDAPYRIRMKRDGPKIRISGCRSSGK